MFRKRLVSVLVPVLALSLWPAVAGCAALAEAGGAAGTSALEGSLRRQPLSFEANRGQFDPKVLFVSRGPGYNLSLTREGASLLFATPRTVAVDLRLVGGNAAPEVVGESPAAAPAHYFVGNDKSRWRSGVPTYQNVRYPAVYQGVDLVFHGRGGRLEYDFIVAPGADPGQIELDVRGADELVLDADGSLVMNVGGQSLIQPRPFIYQDGPAGRTEVAGGYVVRDDRVKFTVASYDRSLPLVIDPVFTLNSSFGGSELEEIFGVAHDSQGNIWATGVTASPDLPVAGAIDGSYGGMGDTFILKYDKAGNLLFATYLGGADFEQSWGMTLDKAGNAYIVGNTKSADFPRVGGLQRPLAGDRDAYLVKLNPTGSRIIFSTLLGGRETDWGYSVQLDAKGAIYVAGETESPDFPVVSAVQPTYKGGEDGFVTKLTPDAKTIIYSTFVGGGNHERIWGIAVDRQGRAYLAGQTGSPNFPTVKAFQRTYGGGRTDAFMTALSADGKKFLYSTYAGGTSMDQGFAVAVDAKGNARFVGGAGNSSFPVRQAIQSAFAGGPSDSFVLGLSKTGSLQFSTLLGGSLGDAAFAVGLDAKANIYVTGQTESPNHPVRNAMQSSLGGLRDGFLIKLRPDGKAFLYSTFFGGETIDEGTVIDVDPSGLVHLGGFTDGPVEEDQAKFSGVRDGVIARVVETKQAPSVSCAAETKRLPGSDGGLIDVGLSVEVDNGGDVEMAVFSDDGATADDIDSSEEGRLLLRAVTSSPDSDRVYLVLVTAKDGAGNRGTATCSVIVPRTSAPEDTARVFARAAAVENYFERQRVPPAGFARLGRTGAEAQ
jgi:hypothetical protein